MIAEMTAITNSPYLHTLISALHGELTDRFFIERYAS